MKIKNLLLISLLTTLSACYSGVSIKKTPVMASDVVKSSQSDARYPLYIAGISLANHNESSEFADRLLKKLNQTGLYKPVVYSAYGRKPEPPFINANLAITEIYDAHSVSNGFKRFFTWLTVFTLAPVLPLEFDVEDTLQLLVTWPGGRSSSYSANCAASAYGTIDRAKESDLKALWENGGLCLNSIVNQMSADYPRMVSSQ